MSSPNTVLNIEIISIGVFREILKERKINISMNFSNSAPHIFQVIEKLDTSYSGLITKELYLDDGTLNPWTRILLNGYDIRFLDEPKPLVHDGDTILFSSVLAGG